ncbi:hypothetical protein NDU88_005111, partial [Pleurodeles waltl]
FYLTYAAELAPKLVELHKAARNQGGLPASTHKALTVPLLMPVKSPTDCRAYRPLSMMNVDCKILSKILAAKLVLLMTKLVHLDQAGFIPSGNPGLNIQRLLLLLETTSYDREMAAVLSIDYEKDFDSLEWGFLYEVMKQMHLRDGFLA